MVDISKFVKERNDAIFSLDKQKILKYARKYGVWVPENEIAFWGAVYKAICNISDAPPDLKNKAVEWLHNHGMTSEIK